MTLHRMKHYVQLTIERWLFVPRGCAVFHVPVRNQHIIRTALPTSHGFDPLPSAEVLHSHQMPRLKSYFVELFEFVGTLDNAPLLCIPAALKFREEVCGGDAAIKKYNNDLALKGAKHVAQVLGTEILDNEEGTLTKCCLVNVRLPLVIDISKPGHYTVKSKDAAEIHPFITTDLNKSYNTYIQILFHNNSWWARLSGQIYLEFEDFEKGAQTLKEVMKKVGRGEHINRTKIPSLL
jgi:hercynylcysteine S-oxide lyase